MKIGLLGFGTVGSGVYEILNDPKMIKEEITIKSALVRNVEKYRAAYSDKVHFVSNADEILEDPQIDLVVEVLGGIEEPFKYISKALRSGKSVVTANKAVLAAHMEQLITLAKENNVSLLYEASVGGGIPLVKTLVESGRTNTFTEIFGILNGTSNYILTKMAWEGLTFEQALREAQEAGYAEADPTDDIDGADIARKVSVLTTTVSGRHLPVDAIPMHGIRTIRTCDMEYAKTIGCVIKMIGRAKISDKGFYCSVEPQFVPNDSIVAQVNGAFNIGVARGNFLTEVSFYGEGAGKHATAAAVVSDILDIRAAGDRPLFYQERIDFSKCSVETLTGSFYIRFEKVSSEDAENLLKKHDIGYQKIDVAHIAFRIDGSDPVKMRSLLKDLNDNQIEHFKAVLEVK